MDKLVRDKAISAGTRLLFDFSNSYSNPNADGALKPGASFANLVDGAPGAVIEGSSSIALLNNRTTTGGIKSPGAASAGQSIVFGKSYSLHATSPSLIATAWVKCPSDAVAVAYQGIFQLIGTNNQSSLFAFDTGASGKSLRVNANNQNNTPSYRDIPGFTVDVVHQVGASWRPGFVDVIFDGKVIFTFGNANPLLLDLSAYNMTALTGRQSTTLYRLFFEDLSLSRRSASEAAAADFASAKGLYS